MKIYIITQNDPFYLPAFFTKVTNVLKNDIVGVSILGENKYKTKTLRKFFHFYGFRLFCITLIWYAIRKISDISSSILPVNELHSIGRICRRHNIKIAETTNINSEKFIKQLKELKVDIIVSVAAPQIFKKDLINAAPLGCINVHGAPLPRYRGMMPSFWMLLNGEKKGAVTVHYMDEELDSGDIILQKEYEINPGITHHELMIKSKKLSADLLIEALVVIKNGRVERKQNDSKQATYYSFPQKEDLRKFYKAGGEVEVIEGI